MEYNTNIPCQYIVNFKHRQPLKESGAEKKKTNLKIDCSHTHRNHQIPNVAARSATYIHTSLALIFSSPTPEYSLSILSQRSLARFHVIQTSSPVPYLAWLKQTDVFAVYISFFAIIYPIHISIHISIHTRANSRPLYHTQLIYSILQDLVYFLVQHSSM